MIKLSARQLTALRWVAYVSGYVLLLVVFAYLSFPYGRLKQYVVSTYNAQQTGAVRNRLEIDDLGWSWRFPGVTAEGVRLVIGQLPPAEGQRKPPPQYLELDSAFVSVSALALVTGAKEASFGATGLGDGTVWGWARDSEEARQLELELDGVNPGRIPQLVEAVGLPIQGLLSGKISLVLPQGELAKAEGTVALAAEDLSVGDGKAKIQNTLALPELHMGAFTFKAEVNGGRLRIEECVAHGRDVDLSVTGSLKLRRRLEISQADMELKFQFSEKYKTQSDLTKALFGQPDSKVPGLFDTATRAVLAKQDDGGYGARLLGPIVRLKPRPLSARRPKAAGGAAERRRATSRRAPRRSARKASEEKAAADDGDGDGADDDEE